MGLFKKKSKLRQEFNEQFLSLMNRQKESWEKYKKMEEIIVEEHPKLRAERKLAQAKYFYLFKEAKIRQIRGS